MEVNKLKVIYDIASIPDELDIEDVIINIPKIYQTIFWDSMNGGKEPKIINDHDLKVVDYNTEEGKEILKKFKTINGTDKHK